MRLIRLLVPLLLAALACTFTYGFEPPPTNPPDGGSGPTGEQGVVVNVIDGDTIDVRLSSGEARVRYVGVNTPERDEPCYSEARRANADLVQGQTVTLVRDTSDTDRFGRLLRYVYVGEVLVNARLIEQGFAEVVSYPPDTARFNEFRQLEDQARAARRGCHPTGIFDDNTYER
jgi:endonuclease YncB( thermonuclease family)